MSLLSIYAVLITVYALFKYWQVKRMVEWANEVTQWGEQAQSEMNAIRKTTEEEWARKNSRIFHLERELKEQRSLVDHLKARLGGN